MMRTRGMGLALRRVQDLTVKLAMIPKRMIVMTIVARVLIIVGGLRARTQFNKRLKCLRMCSITSVLICQ